MVRRGMCTRCGRSDLYLPVRPDQRYLDALAVSTQRHAEGGRASEATSGLGDHEVRVQESKPGRLVSLNTMPPHLSSKR